MGLSETSEASVDEIADGLWAIRVPMPRHPLRASFCYAYIGADGGSAVIDPGWPTEDSWTALADGLRRIGSSPEQTRTILLTHAHRDHSGLAGRLAEVSGAEVAIHPEDRALLTSGDASHRRRVDAWLTEVGVPGAGDRREAALGTALPRLPEPLTVTRSLDDGAVIPVPGGELIVHWTPGHTPGQVCFEDAGRGLLFTGDHLLPRITPNISSMVGHRASALTDYLTSLVKVGALHVDRALPGHEYAFDGVGTRVTELLAHHRRRLDEIAEVLTARREWTTLEVARELTWSRPWEQIAGLQQRAALGEVLAHLHFLRTAGAVRASEGETPVRWAPLAPEALDAAWSRAEFGVPA